MKCYRCKSFPTTGLGLYDIPNSRQTVCYVMNDINDGQRIARERHRKGRNVLYLDWHSGYVAAEDMTVDMRRDK